MLRLTQSIERIVDFCCDNKISFRLDFPSEHTYQITLCHENTEEELEIYDTRNDNIVEWNLVDYPSEAIEGEIKDLTDFLKIVKEWAGSDTKFRFLIAEESTAEEIGNYITKYLKPNMEVSINTYLNDTDNKITVKIMVNDNLKDVFKLR